MTELKYKVCTSCQAENNPSFLFCWKCGHAFDTSTVVTSTFSGDKVQRKAFAVLSWLLSFGYGLFAFQDYQNGQKWIPDVFSAFLWCWSGFINLYAYKLSKKSKWILVAVTLLVFGVIFAFLRFKKLI